MNIKIHTKFLILSLLVLITLLLFSGLLFKSFVKRFISPAGLIAPTQTPTPPTDIFVPQDADIEQLITKTKQDLSSRLNISSTNIEVVQTVKKNWSDTSLGCPKAGKVYAQVITPGFLIVLGVSGNNYNYHTSSEEFILCQ